MKKLNGKNHLSRKMSRVSLAVGLAFILSDTASSAVVWLTDPSVTLQHSYDDNYFLSSDSSNEDEVSTTTLTGELALRGKSDKLDLKTLLRVDKVNFSGDDDRLSNRDNQLLGFSTRYRVSRRNRFLFDGQINRDTIIRTGRIENDPENLLEDDSVVGVGDLDDADVSLVDENVRRTRTEFRPGWRYQYSELGSLNLEYRYDDQSYSGDRGTGLVESDRQSLKGGWRYRVSEKSIVTAQLTAGYFRPDNNRDVDTYESRIGLIRRFTETITLDFTLGGRYSEFDNSDENNDTGFVANIGATKLAGRTTYRANLERRVNPSGSGDQVERDVLTLNVKHALTENMSFNLRAKAEVRENTGGNDNNGDRDFAVLRPGISWRLSPSWVANLSYRYRYRDIDNNPDGSSDSSAAFISIGYVPPRQF